MTSKPADFFHRATADTYGWTFSDHAFSAPTDGDGGPITALSAPDSTLVLRGAAGRGLVRAGPFLSPSSQAQVKLAVGNTTAEAVAALVKDQLPPPGGGSVLDSYEVLLLALQLGLLRDLETKTTTLATLAEGCHTRSFARQGGGHVWTVQAPASGTPDQRAAGSRPWTSASAERLYLLNRAQEAYDTARDLITAARAQLFMDWTVYAGQAAADFPVPGPHDIPTSRPRPLPRLHRPRRAAAGTGPRDRGRPGHVPGRQLGNHRGEHREPGGHQGRRPRRGLRRRAGEPAGRGRLGAGARPCGTVRDAHRPGAGGAGKGDRVGPAQRVAAVPRRASGVRADHPAPGERPGRPGHGRADAGLCRGPGRACGGPDRRRPRSGPALLGEAALLAPQSAGLLAAALHGRGFAASPADLAAAVQGCQGGGSPFAATSAAASPAAGGAVPAADGLFGASRKVDTAASSGGSPFAGPQPSQELTPLRVVFGNQAASALAPNSVGWSAQAEYPELGLGDSRADPFLPLWLSWSASTWPRRSSTASTRRRSCRAASGSTSTASTLPTRSPAARRAAGWSPTRPPAAPGRRCCHPRRWAA